MTQLDLFTDVRDDEPEPSLKPQPAPAPSKATRDDMADSPLVMTLRLAVPLWIATAAEYDQQGRAGLLERWRVDGLDVVAHRGDNILFLGPKKGDTAKAFNALARGLAALAHQPGGVCAFGIVWCAAHSPGGATPADRGAVCARCDDQPPEPPPAGQVSDASRLKDKTVETVDTRGLT